MVKKGRITNVRDLPLKKILEIIAGMQSKNCFRDYVHILKLVRGKLSDENETKEFIDNYNGFGFVFRLVLNRKPIYSNGDAQRGLMERFLRYNCDSHSEKEGGTIVAIRNTSFHPNSNLEQVAIYSSDDPRCPMVHKQSGRKPMLTTLDRFLSENLSRYPEFHTPKNLRFSY